MIKPISRPEAVDILTWRYEAPFDFYDPPQHDDPELFIEQFLARQNGFHSIFDQQQQFVGFCSFGLDGQVAGGDYQLPALDIGLGMSPRFVGLGLGEVFMTEIMGFAYATLNAKKLRLTVADFNKRAIKVYERCGFQSIHAFHDDFNVPHTIMLR